MQGNKNYCNETLQVFKRKHYSFFQQPIVQSFLQDETYRELVEQAICHPTEEHRQEVDEAFKDYYGQLKALTYLSSLIYYNAINFDKTMKKHDDREMLTLDQPLQKNDEEGTTHKDMLYQSPSDITDAIVRETIFDYVGEKRLYDAIQTLTPKQQDILTHKYVRGLQNKEIAVLFDDSPQNVSKLHQRALRKLRNQLYKERCCHDDS